MATEVSILTSKLHYTRAIVHDQRREIIRLRRLVADLRDIIEVQRVKDGARPVEWGQAKKVLEV